MQDGGAAVNLARVRVDVGHVGWWLRLLLGVGVLLVRAQDGDLLPLFAGLRRLGAGLQQMESLAIFFYEIKL